MIPTRLLLLCRVAVLCLVTMPLQAQTRVDTWTTDNGLPQNSVTALTQTPDGYIWLTTQEGLVRFDGVRFTVFNRSNTPAITNNRMSGAFADRGGTNLDEHRGRGDSFVRERGSSASP